MYKIQLAILILIANIITILQLLNLYYILYSLLINIQSVLLVYLFNFAVNLVFDFTKREIVIPFQLQSYYEIINRCPYSLIKTLSLGIERKIYQLALTRYFLRIVMSTYKTFNRLIRLDKQLFNKRVATTIINSLLITKFLNTNKDQFTIITLAYKYILIYKKISISFFKNT